MKLLIALQYWTGDRDLAKRLAELIWRIRGDKDPSLVMVGRSDCEPLVIDAPYFFYATGDGPTGWPAGPNHMAVDLIKQIHYRYQFGGWGNFDAALLMEPDCIPVQKDWISQLEAEWDTVKEKAWMMGCWRASPDWVGHINGNCVIRPDFAKLVDLRVDPGLAWDCAIAPQVKDHWHNTSLISNRYEERKVPDEVIMTPYNAIKADPATLKPPVLVHGVKDDSVYDYAVKKLLS